MPTELQPVLGALLFSASRKKRQLWLGSRLGARANGCVQLAVSSTPRAKYYVFFPRKKCVRPRRRANDVQYAWSRFFVVRAVTSAEQW